MANLHANCKGFYTRILNDQKSSFDYILTSSSIYDRTSEVHIDEEGSFDIDSDHVLMSLTFNTKTQIRYSVKQTPKRVWNFNDLTNRDHFSESLYNGLSSWDVNPSLSTDDNWLNFKRILNNTAVQTIGKKHIPNNYKSFCDKDNKRFIHERREINRLNRNVPSDSSMNGKIENIYKERKERMQHAIKRKRHEQERKSFLNKISKSKNKSKAFWNFVKGTKAQPQSHLIDPDDYENVLESNHEINEALKSTLVILVTIALYRR